MCIFSIEQLLPAFIAGDKKNPDLPDCQNCAYKDDAQGPVKPLDALILQPALIISERQIKKAMTP